MRLVERHNSVDLTEVVVCEARTHLTVALEVQEHSEVGQGPDKVGNVIRLGGLERSISREPTITHFVLGFAGRFPFVSL